MKVNSPGRAPIIWFDVTAAIEWRGRPVGTIRVARELSEAMARVLPEAQFATCAWLDGGYVECDDDTRKKLRERALSRRRSPVADTPRFSGLQRGRLFVSALVSLAPAPLRPVVRRVASIVVGVARSLRTLIDRARRLALRSREAEPTSVASESGMPFHPGDVLVTVDIDWRNRLVPRLARIAENCGIRIVICCYDMIPVVLPHCAKEDLRSVYPLLVAGSARASEVMLCISRQTREDLLAFLDREGIEAPKTAVVRLGDELPVDREPGNCRFSGQLKVPFILFVSTIEPRKNHAMLYRAYRLLVDRGLGEQLPVLVFCGGIGWHVDNLVNDLRADPVVRGKLLVINDAEDDELEWLYRNARFCLYPSLYEGWGLPVAEALMHGRAVLCSGAASLPEVGGDLVRYVDPWCPHAWAEAILDWINDPSALARWEARIRAEYTPASWDETARQVASAVGFEVRESAYPMSSDSSRGGHGG